MMVRMNFVEPVITLAKHAQIIQSVCFVMIRCLGARQLVCVHALRSIIIVARINCVYIASIRVQHVLLEQAALLVTQSHHIEQ